MAYFKVMSIFVFGITFVVQALFFFARRPIVRLFTNDTAVEELAIDCMYIIVLAFLPDNI